MKIMVTIENVTRYAPNVLAGSIAPDGVAKLGNALSTAGGPSVVLVEDVEFDIECSRMSFPFGAARVLNLGTTDEAVFVSAAADWDENGPSAGVDSISAPDVRLGFGDRDCVKAFHRLPDDLQEAAQILIEHIRQLDPSGDLQHKHPRYVNAPDNWVTLQAQPQVKDILVTFKGSAKTALTPASARRPYQGFKVRSLDDVPEAKRVLSLAQRRK